MGNFYVAFKSSKATQVSAVIAANKGKIKFLPKQV